MGAPPWCPIVGRHTHQLRVHPIRIPQLLILGHPIVRPIKLHIRYPLVQPLDTGGLLQPLSQIFANLSEDGDLARKDLLVGAYLHLTRDVADEALSGAIVEDFLPEDARGVEVFGADFGEEGDGVPDEVAVGFV